MFYCLLDLSCGECDVISCLVSCVSDSVCELLGKTIRNILAAVVILLLNVMEVLSVGGGAFLDITCMVFHRVGVLCM